MDTISVVIALYFPVAVVIGAFSSALAERLRPLRWAVWIGLADLSVYVFEFACAPP